MKINNCNKSGTLPPTLPLDQQSGLEALTQVLETNPTRMSFLPQESESVVYNEQPLSPQIPNSQQLQAQLLASFPHQSGSFLWNYNNHSISPIQGSASSKSLYGNIAVNKTANNFEIQGCESKKLAQQCESSEEGEQFCEQNDIESSSNQGYLSLNVNSIVPEYTEFDQSQVNVGCVGTILSTSTKGDNKRYNRNESKSQKSKSRPHKGQVKSSKKSQKIKQLLSTRLKQDEGPNRGSITSTTTTTDNISTHSQIICSTPDSVPAFPKSTELFASNLMRKVLIQDVLSTNKQSNNNAPSLNTKPIVTQLIPGILPNMASSHLVPCNITRLQPELVETNSVGLQSVPSLTQFLSGNTITGIQSVSPLQGSHTTQLLSGTSSTISQLMPSKRSTGLQSSPGQTHISGTAGLQQSSGICQLSPGSLSTVTSMLGQLISTGSTHQEKQSELSVISKQSSTPTSLPLIENEMTLLGEEPDVSKNTTQSEQQDTSIAQLKSSQSTSTEVDSLISLNLSSLSSQGPAQQGSILIPLNQCEKANSENITVNYQQLQSVLSSLISGLQGQLDATQKLVPPIVATSVQNLLNHKPLSTGLNLPLQDIASSNPISDAPFSFVPFPLNNKENQMNCNTDEQNTTNSTVENNSSLICQSKSDQLEQLTGLQNRGVGNQLAVDSGLVDEGNQLFMMNTEDRLVEDSFLSEQSEPLYDDQNFLYNKTNMESYLNSRGDNSGAALENIDQGILSSQVPVEIPGCQNLPDSNTSKTQMILSHDDSEEDSTDVPNIFKQYCLSCKAAMLNEECQFHKINYNHIKDTPILSKARTSIPACLALQPTSTFGNYNVYLGVWTKENIPAQTKFGPLVGKITPESEKKEDTASCFPGWKIFLDTKSETIDMCDENECNWMMFIKPARCEKTQNLIAHQLGHHIYFFTTKEVFCGQELLYWFSKEYATLSGLPFLASEASLSECLICGKVFIDKSTRKLHMKEHPTYQKYKCHICDHLYSSLSSLNRHTLIHMGVKPYVCDICNKNFTDKSNLKVHLKLHTGMKLFSCNVCEKTFQQKAHLKTHMVIHTGQKNLRCYFCDKSFAREGDRKQHEYQHTKEKSFKCEECGRVFYKLQNYKRHMLIHTGVRDFECQFCMKCFARKFHLQRHMEKCQARNEIFEDKDLILNNVDFKGILNS